jgi:orotate phosphoribosyltransferase
LQDHGDDPAAIIDHACRISREREEVEALFTILTDKASALLGNRHPSAISGGQRRDWLFSGPVAKRLGIPHIAIFKPDSGAVNRQQRIFIETPSGDRVENPDLTGYHVLHIADLLTRGSSIYSAPAGEKAVSGWLPAVRHRGAALKDLLVVVSRSQGGEEMLAEQGLYTHSCLQVNAGFVKRYGRNRESILQFLHNPAQWTKNYLEQQGIDVLLPYTEKDPKKLPRLEKFLRHYRDFLESRGWLETLQRRSGHEAA